MEALRHLQHKIMVTIGLTEQRMAVKMILINASGRTTVVTQVQIVKPEYPHTEEIAQDIADKIKDITGEG